MATRDLHAELTVVCNECDRYWTVWLDGDMSPKMIGVSVEHELKTAFEKGPCECMKSVDGPH